jgi:dipeptidyl aminopeptidase/acylaminoacyl peptidase
MIAMGKAGMGVRLGLAAWAGLLAVSGAIGECQTLTPEHIAKLRRVTEAEISPDGRRVAYVLSVPRVPYEDDDGRPWSELHVSDLEGASHPFVSGEVSVSEVHWTPDGHGIAFLAKRGDDEKDALYVIPVDGGEAQRKVSHAEDITGYTFSPDGRRVAFLAREPEGKMEKQLAKKGFTAEVYEEEWRPVKVWIVALDDPEAEPKALDLGGSASELHWSPTGDRLALALAPTSLIDDHYMRRRIHVVDSDSGVVVARIDNPGKLGAIVWSPDGTRLAVISAEDIHDPREGRLMLGSVDGGPLVDLLPGYAGHVVDVAWRDADTVLFVGHVGVEATLGEISMGDSTPRTLMEPGGPILQALSVSDEGEVAAFVADTPRHPDEVYSARLGEGAPVRQTDSNPWLADMRLAVQESVTWKARDGLELQGLLIRPLDEVAGQRYPLILSVHGGPEAHRSDGWLTTYSAPGQFAAAEGFAVFYPNYRGSTGRGVEFSKMGQADYAGAEFDDLVDAVDHLVETGLVDRERVGITGGSYGGFAAAWGATALSEHFAASVMFVGISDQISKAGTTDIPHEMHLVHSRRWPWEHWDWFRERSPLFHVENSRTPILILHGREDPRVHPSQSMELYRYLKLLGQTPVRLVFYPGEGHGNRRAAARLDYSLRLMRWMRHYLVGPGGDPPPPELEVHEERIAQTGEE